jgi:hypothetical protein
MKRFLLHIGLLLLGTLLIMVLLDAAYTKAYEASAPRTKFQLLRSYKGQKIDYAFLGSSRVDNDINPAVIEKETGKKGLNLGFQGSKLRDIYTILQLFKEYDIGCDKIYIQVDYIFNDQTSSNLMAYEMVPFVHDNAVTQAHFRNSGNSAYYRVPFYRYCMNDYKIGFREVCLNLLKKKTSIAQNSGYSPVFACNLKSKEVLPKTIAAHNPAFDSIRVYCAKNHIEPVFFCSPIKKSTENLDYIQKLQRKIPGLHDYSMLVTNDSLFNNSYHLNDKGATFFSEFVSKALIK